MRQLFHALLMVAMTAICSSLLLPGVAAVRQPPVDADPEAVLQGREAAFNSKDIEAVLELFAEDAVLISGTRRLTYTGRDAIRGFVQDQAARNQPHLPQEGELTHLLRDALFGRAAGSVLLVSHMRPQLGRGRCWK